MRLSRRRCTVDIQFQVIERTSHGKRVDTGHKVAIEQVIVIAGQVQHFELFRLYVQVHTHILKKVVR